jgi:hypothetical protein
LAREKARGVIVLPGIGKGWSISAIEKDFRLRFLSPA